MMIKLYLITGGLSNNFINFFVKKSPSVVNVGTNFISDQNRDNILLNDLRKNGYVIVENFIDSEKINKILNHFSKKKGFYHQDYVENKKIYDHSNPEQVKFEYDEETILSSETLRNIIFEKNILNFARNYLNSEPILDILALWWSSYSKSADQKAAQWWHFDMDRPRWLKFFIYLTDCNESNGPHCIIKRTHKNHSVPWAIRKKGYSRISDDLVNKCFPKENIVEITANKGTLLIEDSRALHKGKKIEVGNRLMFQLQFTSSLFGADYKKFKIDYKNHEFLKAKQMHPYAYQLFDYE